MTKDEVDTNQENHPQALADRLEACYSGAVYDVLRAMGLPGQVIPNNIRPLDITTKLAGPIFTVSGRRKPDLDAHQTLLAWTGLLSKAPKGSVILCQPNDADGRIAYMGELSAEVLQFRGVRGYIVDGACRDSTFIQRIGFKVFCSHCTPVDVVGRWIPEEFEQPIVIGDVKIRNGDFVMADRDGTLIIPAEIALEVVERTEKVLRTESLVRKAILQGTDPQEAYLTYGKF